MNTSVLVDGLVLLKQYGPLLVVAIVVLWQSWIRECRMNRRIRKLEDQQHDVLVPLVERCADVIAQNTKMMERLEKMMDERFVCPLKGQCVV